MDYAFYREIGELWQQGDIVIVPASSTVLAQLKILLTPQCDLVQEKAEFLLFAKGADFNNCFQTIVDPKNDLTEDHFRGVIELSKSKLTDVISNFQKHFNGAQANRFYLLPEYSRGDLGIPPTFIDFQQIESVPYDLLKDLNLYRKLGIADPFRAQLITRYLAFVGRIGTPELTLEILENVLQESGLKFAKEAFADICSRKLIV